MGAFGCVSEARIVLDFGAYIKISRLSISGSFSAILYYSLRIGEYYIERTCRISLR
jgi:hypothetical protein